MWVNYRWGPRIPIILEHFDVDLVYQQLYTCRLHTVCRLWTEVAIITFVCTMYFSEFVYWSGLWAISGSVWTEIDDRLRAVIVVHILPESMEIRGNKGEWIPQGSSLNPPPPPPFEKKTSVEQLDRSAMGHQRRSPTVWNTQQIYTCLVVLSSPAHVLALLSPLGP